MTTAKERKRLERLRTVRKMEEKLIREVSVAASEALGLRLEKIYIPSRPAVLQQLVPLELFDDDSQLLTELPRGFRGLKNGT